MDHAQMEEHLSADMREVVRQLFQDHLGLRELREQRLAGVRGAQGAVHGAVEAGHERPLATIFGAVAVRRLAYRHRGEDNLYPADGLLNLPEERYSYGLRRRGAEESSRGSFDEAVAAIKRSCGQHVPKRQVQELAQRAAADFEAFYEQAERLEAKDGDVVVLSADGKGIVMRPDALRPATAKGRRPKSSLPGSQKASAATANAWP